MGVKASAETLRSIPIFSECDPVHLQVMAFSAQRQIFQPGEALMRQGETGHAAYLMLDGQAELLRDDGEGGRHLGQAGPGALIGEISMIAERPYAFTAIAQMATEAMRIDRQLFMRLAEEYPEFGARVFRAIARRLDGSMADLFDVKGSFDRARSFSNL